MRSNVYHSCRLPASLTVVGLLVFLCTEVYGQGKPEVIQNGTMSEERAAHQATLLQNGQVLITGGCAGRGCGNILSSAELYDPDSKTFKTVSSMVMPRAGHAAVALSDGRVLVAGGWNGSKSTSIAEIYDPAAKRWKTVGEMSVARASLITVLLPDSTVLIAGGGEGGPGTLEELEIFDPSLEEFIQLGETEINYYLATLMADGRVLMTGGHTGDGKVHSGAGIFDPATGNVRQTGNMNSPRVKHGAVLLDDGRILIIGGSDNRGYRGRTARTEIYDPGTGKFSECPQMEFGRHKIRDAVSRLPSGKILVAGGADQPELYDPEKQEFRLVEGQLSGPQMFATSTLLPDGEVLVLGGYDERTQTTDKAWVIKIY